MNIFALYPKTLTYLEEILVQFKEKHKEDRKIESLLPVELTNLIKNNKLIINVYSSPEKWIGVTNPEDELIVKNILKYTK